MIFSPELFIASEEINLYDSSEKFWIIFESTEVDAIYHPFPSRNFDLEIKISTIVYYSKNLSKSNISTSQIFPIISIQTAHNESTGKPISHRSTTPHVFLFRKKGKKILHWFERSPRSKFESFLTAIIPGMHMADFLLPDLSS